jgi:hypothetical protein
MRGDGRKEEASHPGLKEGEPERSESPREYAVPTRANHLGCSRGTAFQMGVNRWSAGARSFEVLPGSAGTEREARKGFSITWKEKNSEGRSPRALGIERGPQGVVS